MHAIVSDDRPTERRSPRLSSRPTSSSRRITPSSPRTSITLFSWMSPSTAGPTITPATISRDHRRDADPLGDLRGELRREEHDDDVDQDVGDVHDAVGARLVHRHEVHEVAAPVHGADVDAGAREQPPQPRHVHVEDVAAGRRRRRATPGGRASRGRRPRSCARAARPARRAWIGGSTTRRLPARSTPSSIDDRAPIARGPLAQRRQADADLGLVGRGPEPVLEPVDASSAGGPCSTITSRGSRGPAAARAVRLRPASAPARHPRVVTVGMRCFAFVSQS